MNQKLNKKLLMRVVLSTLVLIIVSLGTILGVQISKNKQLETQVEALKEVNNLLESNEVKNYVILTYIDEIENKVESFLVDKNLQIPVYQFLLTKTFSVDDFDSYDNINYYFKDAMTDVLELKDNEDFYETSEWDGVTYINLVVGLQAIIIDQNLTVVKSGF